MTNLPGQEYETSASTAPSKPIGVFVKLGDRRCVYTSFDRNATVADVYDRVQDLFSLPDDKLFFLVHTGRGLFKGSLVADHGIKHDATIYVMIRGLGGGGQAESRFPEGSSAHTTPEERGAGGAEGKFWDYGCHGWNGWPCRSVL